MSYYDTWHMTYGQQNMALWVSKDPSQSVEWIFKLSFICYQLNFWHKTQKSDFGHFSLYFEGDSFVKYKCDLAKTHQCSGSFEGKQGQKLPQEYQGYPQSDPDLWMSTSLFI